MKMAGISASTRNFEIGIFLAKHLVRLLCTVQSVHLSFAHHPF